MKKHNEYEPQSINPLYNNVANETENELDDQELENVSGGVGSNSSPFRKQGKAGGPVVHVLGPKQDDPDHGGGRAD